MKRRRIKTKPLVQIKHKIKKVAGIKVYFNHPLMALWSLVMLGYRRTQNPTAEKMARTHQYFKELEVKGRPKKLGQHWNCQGAKSAKLREKALKVLVHLHSLALLMKPLKESIKLGQERPQLDNKYIISSSIKSMKTLLTIIQSQHRLTPVLKEKQMGQTTKDPALIQLRRFWN